MSKAQGIIVLALAVLLVATGSESGAQVEARRDMLGRLPAGVGPGVGARAAAMGDAQVALATDGTALYWNPAGLALGGGAQWHPMSLRYSSEGLGVGDLLDMTDIMNGGDLSAGDYQLLESLEGSVTRIGGSAIVGYRNGNWAVGAYAQGMAVVSVQSRAGGVLQVTGYGLDVTSVGGAYADRLIEDLYWGVQVGWLTGGAGSLGGTAALDGGGNVISNLRHRSNHARDWNANLGLMYQAGERVRGGLVVRNINSPKLSFSPSEVWSFDPSVHLGVGVWSRDGRTVGAADVHNLFRSNGQGAALCLGVEHLVTESVAVRAGLNEGDFTFGAGVGLGSVQLGLAGGFPLDEEITITATIGH